jgi:hypothetical protein
MASVLRLLNSKNNHENAKSYKDDTYRNAPKVMSYNVQDGGYR